MSGDNLWCRRCHSHHHVVDDCEQEHDNDMACPFCGETEFDEVGLKTHLVVGWCLIFDEIDEDVRLF